MATGSPLIKVIVIYFSINLLLFAAGVNVGQLTSGDDIRTSLFYSNSSNNGTGSIIDPTTRYGLGTIQQQTPDVNQQTGGFTGGISFIDAIRSVSGIINFFIVLFGGVFIMFFLFPPAVQLFVGVPLAFMFIIGLVYFVRSGQ